jgi:hypothetical protein
MLGRSVFGKPALAGMFEFVPSDFSVDGDKQAIFMFDILSENSVKIGE